MTGDDWPRVRDVFERALDVEPHRRDRWLEEQPLEAAVRAEVTSLLLHHSRAGSFLAAPLAEQAPQLLDEQEPLCPGAIVGHYTIDTVYAEGFERVDDFAVLPAALRKGGFGDEDVRKILGGNFMRVFEQCWPAAPEQ